MDFQHIRFAVEDRVGRIKFARPPLNVFNIAMMREIGRALDECTRERALAAVVFEAEAGARAFSAGVAVEEHVAETIYQMLDAFHDIFRALDALARPVVAVVDVVVDAVVVVVVSSVPSGGRMLSTGRNCSSAVWPTISSARCWSLTPGSWTMMDSP